jgi:hypothetical protein
MVSAALFLQDRGGPVGRNGPHGVACVVFHVETEATASNSGFGFQLDPAP